MITIKGIIVEGRNTMERALTEKELETVTGSLFDGVNFIFYTGDNPLKEPKEYVQPLEEKVDLSNIDIDSLTDEQIQKLKSRFGL